MELKNDKIQNSEDAETNEDYYRWKKNTPFLYDVVMKKRFTWPNLTVEWLPDITRQEDRDFSIQRLIIGSQTDGTDSNYLAIATAKIPDLGRSIESKYYNAEKDEFGDYGLVDVRIDVSIKINHSGSVHRVRCLPQCPNVIATKSESKDVFLFDYTRHPSKPDINGKCKPDLILKGHSDEGYGLSWCPYKPGLLISCSKDKTIQMWDINQNTHEDAEGRQTLQSCQQFSTGTKRSDTIEDVSWYNFYSGGNLFGSISYGGDVALWDSRVGGQRGPVSQTHDSSEGISIDFSPLSPFLIVTGHENGMVAVRDLRGFRKCVKYLHGHSKPISKVEWSLHRENMLASSSYDHQVLLWDLKKPDKSDNVTNDEFCEQLVFRHMGHCDSVMDFGWNKNVHNMLASVSYDNSLQIWQPSNIIL